MCFRISFSGEEPDDLAASMYSFSLIDSTWPRTRRARPTQLTSAIAPKIGISWTNQLPLTLHTETTTRTKRRTGNANQRQENRVRKEAQQPPQQPPRRRSARTIATAL